MKKYLMTRNMFKILLNGKKKYLILIIFFQITSGVLPAVILYLMGSAINSLENEDLYLLIIFFLCSLVVLTEIIEITEAVSSSIISDFAKKNVRELLIKKSSSPNSINHLNEKEFQDNFYLTESRIDHISDFIGDISQFMTGFISIISISTLLFSLDWWIPFTVIIGMFPIIYARFKAESKIWEIETDFSSEFSSISKYYECLTRIESSHSIRVDNFRETLFSKWNYTYNLILNRVFKARFKGVLFLVFCSIPGLFLLVFTLYQARESIDPTPGNLMIIFGSILQIRTSLTILIANFSQLIYGFLSTLSLDKIENSNYHYNDILFNNTNDDNIIFMRNVNFSYNESKNKVLGNVSLKFKKNNTYILYGENGSGKSTLTNIISGLYSNFYGEIISNIHPDRILYISQNIRPLPITFREFIDPFNKFNSNDILNALHNFELDFISEINLEYYLVEGFSNYLKLSGGQWQRLLMAKLYLNYFNYDLILLDEINSALDSNGDNLFYQLINYLNAKTALIIISHKKITDHLNVKVTKIKLTNKRR
ncbi:ABC transporter ATP-binding protein [Xenorhabdus innexi]|uniref:Putative Xenobiotic-transporting ATPase n=1 Tax=Xenorhabdus innexi TaxID=290109 RepID=A0A1N6MVR5_9GAMM|nr:ABC transporter ATP-binding protein [Xenorhabdus innexi]PHM37560.1 zinc ABC transporter ATP-binding protein ZnuC [Xenorhabdus innexi]SIP72955.1 putative Xenobiotic-transporting ATPase [Xenorhabdus innexi]